MFKKLEKLKDPDYCESRCPLCTRARAGNLPAKIVQSIELFVTSGGCPSGKARMKKYGVRPNEPLPPQSSPSAPAAAK